MSLEEIVLVTTVRGIQRLKKEYFTKCNSQDNCTSHLPRTHAHVRVSHVDKVGHVDLFYPMIEINWTTLDIGRADRNTSTRQNI